MASGEDLRKALAAAGIIMQTIGNVSLANREAKEKKEKKTRALNIFDIEATEKAKEKEFQVVTARVKGREDLAKEERAHKRTLEVIDYKEGIDTQKKRMTTEERFDSFLQGEYEPKTELESIIFSAKLQKHLKDSGISADGAKPNGTQGGQAGQPVRTGTSIDFYNEVISRASQAQPEPELSGLQQQNLLQDEFKGSVSQQEEQGMLEAVGRLAELGAFKKSPIKSLEKTAVPKDMKDLTALVKADPKFMEDMQLVDILGQMVGVGSPEHERAFKETADSTLARNPKLARQIFTPQEVAAAKQRISKKQQVIDLMVKTYGQDQWESLTAEQQKKIIEAQTN